MWILGVSLGELLVSRFINFLRILRIKRWELLKKENTVMSPKTEDHKLRNSWGNKTKNYKVFINQGFYA